MTQALHLNNVYFTVQGEGVWTGRRSLFVRLPYCNLRCPWCDTSFNSFVRWTEKDFVDLANKGWCGWAVVTGGEPSINPHAARVVELLRAEGYLVAVETNGTHPLPATFNWVTCSPKREAQYAVDPAVAPLVDEYKYVVDRGFDFAVLDRHTSDKAKATLWLTPEHGDLAANVETILRYIEVNPRWRLNLQTHKFINQP